MRSLSITRLGMAMPPSSKCSTNAPSRMILVHTRSSPRSARLRPHVAAIACQFPHDISRSDSTMASLAFSSAALPSNLTLEDEDLLDEPLENDMPHQRAPLDYESADLVRGMPQAVFQRPGLAIGDAALEVPVVPFAEETMGGDDAGDGSSIDAPPPPPPPPPTVTLDARVFGLPLRLDVLQTVVKWQLACRRAGTGSSKRIGAVSGSGKKMRPQKGTGQARAGHKRPPHWRGGAKAHGPVTGGRDWSYKLNKRERRLGLATALSQKLMEGNLSIVDEASASSHRTAALAKKLEGQGLSDALFIVGSDKNGGKGSIIDPEGFRRFSIAANNLPLVHVLPSIGANVYDLLRREKVVLTLGAVSDLQQRLTTPIRRKYWE